MRFREIVVAGALLLTPQTVNDTIKKSTKEEIIHTLCLNAKDRQKKDTPSVFDFEISQDLLHQIDTMCLDVSCPVVFSRSWEDLRNTPLVMKGTRRHIGEYLGYEQYDYILKTYNADTIPDSLKTYADLQMSNFPKIRFPLIYDAISKAVPHTLHDILQREKFALYRDILHAQDTVIISMEVEGKRSLLYYQKGILTLATYSSIGKGKSTPRGLFRVDYHVKYKRSRRYNNASMPYALHVVDNVFIHQGKVSSSVYSHGCIRIPGVYAEVLFYMTTSPSENQIYNQKNHPNDDALKQKIDSLQQMTPKVLIVD